MLRSLVKRIAYPSVIGFPFSLCLTLPGFLFLRKSAKETGAQGDFPVQGRSSCPLSCAAVRSHQFHVSGFYLKNLISAIRFSVDMLN